MRINCTNNLGYTWTENDRIYFRGYIQTQESTVPLRQLSAISYFSKAQSYMDFIERLKNVDGVFSVIVDRADCVWAAVDIARSMPLYYSREGSIISDSAEDIRLNLGISKEAADPSALEEMLVTSDIGFERTAYAEIAQLDVGQAAEFGSDGINTTYYYLHYKEKLAVDRHTAMEMFQRAADKSFDEIVAAIDGRPVVLSLSGGYDSRYVACMLKSHGVEDVSCYSYGRSDSFEIRQSKEVAEKLGYRWRYVEYTDERIRSFLSDENKPYFDMYTGHDSHIYIQNFMAVEHLHKEGWFKKDSVFLTGMCNDMPTGYYAKLQSSIPGYTPTRECLAEYLAAKVCGYNMLENARLEFKSQVLKKLDEMNAEFNSYEEFVGIVDAMLTALEHSRRIMHMNDVHACFGYEWLLPCWNKHNLDFWYSMPLAYRLNQNLYEEWITTTLPAQYGVGEKKKVVSYINYRGWSRFVARILLVLNRTVFLPLGIPLKQEADFNNLTPLLTVLFRRIHQKNLITFRRTNINFIWTLYLMEQWYGKSFYKAVHTLNSGKYE